MIKGRALVSDKSDALELLAMLVEVEGSLSFASTVTDRLKMRSLTRSFLESGLFDEGIFVLDIGLDFASCAFEETEET